MMHKHELDLVNSCLKKLDDCRKIICMPTEDEKKEYDELLDDFIKINSSNCSTQKKGESLEKLVLCLVKNTHMYNLYNNLKTSTNEIDDFFELNDDANYLMVQGLIKGTPLKILGECKNYGKSISVTYIGKFYSLMNVSNIRFGIMFSAKGLSGTTSFRDGKGLVRKIYMIKEKTSEKYNILDFNLEDFERVRNGELFLKIIEEKMDELQLDTSIASYIRKHNAEDLL